MSDREESAPPISRTTPPSGVHLRTGHHSPHTPIEERVAAAFFPCTQPSDEEYTDSEEKALFDPAMDAKPTSCEVSADGGQTFSGKADALPAFLMHVRLKELMDSDLRDQAIKCAYAANQLRRPAQDWFVRTATAQPQLLQRWSALEAALV
ncbi:hypothetical protein K470DRAFT_270608 [Piedraia hortae CBS 480.64]|uniref:Uncharacterized protein n=1 Tax=Piedraia hortae CBS 480.64 TaxID=1314780 RepID=A0A6A7BYW6_9PEZI|nr:hypothetical protein K470DRAFT_270608 [Piedraia hortae CBS 480.64]